MASEHVERKLAAIVAADVAGYARLMGADEEGTLAHLKAHRKALIDPKIAEHHGRIIKTTGDGMLVEFASVVDAVRCVVEIQRGMLERNADIPAEKRIDFRVGINVGDVIVDGDDIYGDGVNIAARLENLAEPGGILVSNVVREQVLDKLSFSFDDLGEQQVKNIARPVRAFRVKLSDDGRIPPPAAKARGTGANAGGPVARIVAAVIVLILIAGGAWFFLVGQKSTVVANAPAHLSIVVLPFANLSNDPRQDYFAHGITDNLTTDLSRIRDSFVIARNTAFTYKGKNIDAKAIGKELGVRYVLEGSVQRDGNRVRVNAQLIDAESGAHLWADRFEDDITDLFKLQDDVVGRLANSLGYELTRAEAAKSVHSTNPDAIDLTMRGWALMWQEPSEDNNRTASDLFRRALTLEPQNVDALVGEAYTVVRAVSFWRAASDSVAPTLEQVNRAIGRPGASAASRRTRSLFVAAEQRIGGDGH